MLPAGINVPQTAIYRCPHSLSVSLHLSALSLTLLPGISPTCLHGLRVFCLALNYFKKGLKLFYMAKRQASGKPARKKGFSFGPANNGNGYLAHAYFPAFLCFLSSTISRERIIRLLLWVFHLIETKMRICPKKVSELLGSLLNGQI